MFENGRAVPRIVEPVVIDNQTVYVEPEGLTCDCGVVVKTKAALAGHRRWAKAHKAAVTA